MIGTYLCDSLLVDMHMCLGVQTLPTLLLSCLSDRQIKPGSKLMSEKLVEELVHLIEGIRDNLDLEMILVKMMELMRGSQPPC